MSSPCLLLRIAALIACRPTWAVRLGVRHGVQHILNSPLNHLTKVRRYPGVSNLDHPFIGVIGFTTP